MAHNEREQSEQSYELRTVQCRMARAALGWGVRDLAGAAQVSADTIARFERGEALQRSTVRAIQTALEGAGCEFISEDDISGPGMRMRKRQVRIGGGRAEARLALYWSATKILAELVKRAAAGSSVMSAYGT